MKGLARVLLLIQLFFFCYRFAPDHRLPSLPEFTEFPGGDRIPHLPEEIHIEMEIVHGVEPHRKDLPREEEMPEICP